MSTGLNQLGDDFLKSQEVRHWWDEERIKHWQAFWQRGVPTRKEERFQQADFSFLTKQNWMFSQLNENEKIHEQIAEHRLDFAGHAILVFVDGVFVPHLSDHPSGVEILLLSEALKKHDLRSHWSDFSAVNYPFASINTALFSEGLFLQLADHCQLSAPLHLLFLGTQNKLSCIQNPRICLTLGERSHLQLFVQHYHPSTDFMNVLTSIQVGSEAELFYDEIQTNNILSKRIATTFIHQQKNSKVHWHAFSSGLNWLRQDVMIVLEEDTQADVSGFYQLLSDQDYVDYHIDIHHRSPRSKSEMVFKGLLEKKSRAVFCGKLTIYKGAETIEAYQASHHLLLSTDAEAFSSPQLEIYADDVKCKHGATVGQLDQEALFYLRSRGMTEAAAKKLLLKGFAEEIFQKLLSPAILRHVQKSLKMEME